MSEPLIEKLHELYADESKHSVYQNVPAFVREALGYTETINEGWRGDSARWKYLREQMDFSGRRVLDVGANTGFFALSLAHQHPDAQIAALEGNANHAAFIREVADTFGMNNVAVLPQYLSLSAVDQLADYDDVLLFNVLHHAGVDFDQDLVQRPEKLLEYLVAYLKKLSEHCHRVVFQMGYNWGGNKQKPVVPLSDDAGKIIYTASAFNAAGYEVKDIAPCYWVDGKVPGEHRSLSEELIAAVNSGSPNELKDALDPKMSDLSEFYRRSLFVCETK